MPDKNPARFHYRNYRGEESVRTVLPARLWFGTSDYHPEPQWFLSGLDLDKNEYRDFALRDCNFTRTTDAP